MYKNNIYIKNHKELSAITKSVRQEDGSITQEVAPIGVRLDVYDDRHGLKHNDLARAQYKHWLSVETGVDKLLTPDDRELLGL